MLTLSALTMSPCLMMAIDFLMSPFCFDEGCQPMSVQDIIHDRIFGLARGARFRLVAAGAFCFPLHIPLVWVFLHHVSQLDRRRSLHRDDSPSVASLSLSLYLCLHDLSVQSRRPISTIAVCCFLGQPPFFNFTALLTSSIAMIVPSACPAGPTVSSRHRAAVRSVSCPRNGPSTMPVVSVASPVTTIPANPAI